MIGSGAAPSAAIPSATKWNTRKDACAGRTPTPTVSGKTGDTCQTRGIQAQRKVKNKSGSYCAVKRWNNTKLAYLLCSKLSLISDIKILRFQY